MGFKLSNSSFTSSRIAFGAVIWGYHQKFSSFEFHLTLLLFTDLDKHRAIKYSRRELKEEPSHPLIKDSRYVHVHAIHCYMCANYPGMCKLDSRRGVDIGTNYSRL